jgi:hypothetical protein
MGSGSGRSTPLAAVSSASTGSRSRGRPAKGSVPTSKTSNKILSEIDVWKLVPDYSKVSFPNPKIECCACMYSECASHKLHRTSYKIRLSQGRKLRVEGLNHGQCKCSSWSYYHSFQNAVTILYSI